MTIKKQWKDGQTSPNTHTPTVDKMNTGTRLEPNNNNKKSTRVGKDLPGKVLHHRLAVAR